MKKIGIMGGSFDPCHIGHINLAKDAKNQYNLDEIIFIPAKLQPFKIDIDVTPSYMRMDMLKLMVEDILDFNVSDIELKRKGLSYTYETMRQLKSIYKERNDNVELYFILGTDAFLNIESWEKSEEFLSENNFLVGSRPGYREDELDHYILLIHKKYNKKIFKVKNKKISISSTYLRKLSDDSEELKKFVGSKVAKYIKENKIYSEDFKGKKNYFKIEDNLDLNYKSKIVFNFLKNNLSEKRLEHTIKVADLSVKLAKHYGEDILKTLFSALCHDLVKEFSIYELNDLISIYGLDSKYIDNRNLAHSKVAEKIVKEFLKVDDKDILNSISYHTTGRENMSLLEKIIFISDVAEENRDYEGVDYIRESLFENINLACYISLKHTLKYLSDQGIEIDEDSIKAYSWFGRKVQNEYKRNGVDG